MFKDPENGEKVFEVVLSDVDLSLKEVVEELHFIEVVIEFLLLH